MPVRLSFRAVILSACLAHCSGTAQAASVDCLVSPRRVTELAFGSPGVVRVIDVDRGDRVKKGQRLASLDTSIEQSNLAIAEAQFEASAAIDAAKAALDLADRQLRRNQQLLERNNVSAGHFEEFQNAYDIARLKLAELDENKRLRALDVARAEAIMALRVIVSPFDGVVVERHVAPGEYVDTKRVLTVSEIDPLFIDMIAPASAFDAVKPGEPIPVTLQHPVGQTVTAEASVIDPFVDASSGTFRIRATLANPQLSIVPGFRCRAELPEAAAGG